VSHWCPARWYILFITIVFCPVKKR
jgi:hypothetical protein